MLQILLLIAIIILIYKYIWIPLTYWKNRNVPYITPAPLLGNFYDVFLYRASMAETVLYLYKEKPNASIVGIFQFSTPCLLVRDSNVLRQITINDFNHFTDHLEKYFIKKTDPILGIVLVALKGQRWREMRSTLSPAFTRSKIRNMFGIIKDCAAQLIDYCNEEIKKQNVNTLELEFKDLFTRYTSDAIATTAFGFPCNSFQDKENAFFRMGQDAGDIKPWRVALINTLPNLMKLLKFRIMSDRIMNYFGTLIHENLKKREKEKIYRPDMLHLMQQVRKGQLKNDTLQLENDEANFAAVKEADLEKPNHLTVLSDDDITAQAFIFFLAGFGTVSTGLCFGVYELALNPDIQKRLQQELDSVEGEVTYDKIMNLKYLDMVVAETLRKWPPFAIIDRVSTKPYTFELDDVKISIDTGMPIIIPVYAIHHDSKFYKCPEKYDPERFSDKNKTKIHPETYLPFGIGPRICIGSRLALMELKTVLYLLFKNFDVVVTKRTSIPLVLKKTSIQFTSKDGFWLGLKKRNQ